MTFTIDVYLYVFYLVADNLNISHFEPSGLSNRIARSHIYKVKGVYFCQKICVIVPLRYNISFVLGPWIAEPVQAVAAQPLREAVHARRQAQGEALQQGQAVHQQGQGVQ